jgi:hypothetical protein
MKRDDRVLGRKGARELTRSEAERVTGSVRIVTQTVCTNLFNTAAFDGDPGECSPF